MTLMTPVRYFAHRLSDRLNASSLELASTQELVNELLSRQQFVGILVMSSRENRPGAIHSQHDFSCITTLTGDQTKLILQEAINSIED